MHIERILVAPGLGGYFNDDQLAIKNGAQKDGEYYQGKPQTPGFRTVREPAQSLSLGLALSDGFIAWGDMMSVQYAAACGRDPLFRSEAFANSILAELEPMLRGLNIDTFRVSLDRINTLPLMPELQHAGVQYGLSQSLLQASAHSCGNTLCEQICHEYDLPLTPQPIPLYVQSGDERYGNADKMILKSVDILPHGLFNSPEKFGANGSVFLGYVSWLTARIRQIGGPGYQPILYFDVYGMPGFTLGFDPKRLADFIQQLEQLASPYKVRLESPVSMDSAEAQIDLFAAIRSELKRRDCTVEIAVDEWCNSMTDIDRFIAAKAADVIQIKMPDMGSLDNSIRAVMRCRESRVAAYLGGSCTETDLSARVSIQTAVATQADMLLAKPGMGVDESLMIVNNEQSRLLTELEYRAERNAAG